MWGLDICLIGKGKGGLDVYVSTFIDYGELCVARSNRMVQIMSSEYASSMSPMDFPKSIIDLPSPVQIEKIAINEQNIVQYPYARTAIFAQPTELSIPHVL